MENLEELDKLLESDNEKKDKIENRNDEINNLIEQSEVLKKIANLSEEHHKIIKLYIKNNLFSLNNQTEAQKTSNNITYNSIKSCADENYDYLTYIVNCRQRVDTGIARTSRDGKIGEFLTRCRDCKLQECIKSIMFNFINEINVYNEKNKTKIKYIDVINNILKSEDPKLEDFKDISKFNEIDYYDLIYIQAIVDSELVYISEFDESNKILEFRYIKLDDREDYVFYANKLLDFYKKESYTQVKIKLDKFSLKQNKSESKREYLTRVSAWFTYIIQYEKMDILKALDEYLKPGCGLISSTRSVYFAERYKNKILELPYSQKVKQKIIELFNYIINYNFNGNTPYIPINIIMYTEDKEGAENITRIISDFMWYFNYLPENRGFYKESMNNMILDRYIIGKIYYDAETKRQKKGTLIIDNFENLLYTEDLKSNMIINLLTDQIEKCKGICTVIYGNKENISSIIEKYPKLNYNLFNIKLEVDELDIDALYKVILEKLNKTQVVDEKAKAKIYNYIKSSYNRSEVKEMDYINKLYNHIILNKNRIINTDKSKVIIDENIPDVYNTRNLSEVLKELNSLVGLHDIKRQIDNLIHLLKFNKKVNIDMSKNNLHMVFTGNPGTGKTTVARIISDILYNLGYIKQNKLVEVSAKDLVADYVGQTAGKTFRILKSAFGGVLFIDEAYSILSSGSSSFGAECIATIIKMMEDHKDELIIIFAGYEKEMEEFIKSNPGLKSRIGYEIKFKDYNVDELMEIFDILLNNNNLKIEDDAKELVREVIYESTKIENFGNGRYVNNLFQNILIEHAKNTSGTDDEEKLYTITVSDINKENLVAKKDLKKRIGF